MKRRVLIIGGGCGGVAAAWALSNSAHQRARFDVTLIQPGWRLGGKGATGRDARRGQGVLEHGLHLWLGFYRQAFGMVRDLYDAWEGPTAGPQRSIEAAFAPLYDVALQGRGDDCWRMTFPELPGRPWDGRTNDAWSWFRVGATWLANIGSALDDELRPDARRDRMVLLAGLSGVMARGLASERFRHGANCWDAMDHHDFRAWLRRHGASEAQVQAPVIGALYDLGFAYPDGDANRGAMAAGAALRALLQIFGAYRGAPFWKMTAGMGDTVFAPAWDVLKQRGVHMRLFHRVHDMHVADDAVAAVDVAVQAEGAESYDPLIDVGDVRAWPSAPLLDRLGGVASGALETSSRASLRTLRLERGRDFDDVVLAVPPAAQRQFATALATASPRYAAMVEHSHAVATVAAQMWTSRTPAQLGWRGASGVATGSEGLFRTWADMSDVIDAEAWPTRPAALSYFCSVAPPEVQRATTEEEALAALTPELERWQNGALLEQWPGAATGGRFDEGCLGGAQNASYVRANVAPWERYVLSLPGTMQHRLAPDESGLSNLMLAGDWTRNIINGGSVEGAVSSGIEAARALER